jgi:hypothetical protein
MVVGVGVSQQTRKTSILWFRQDSSLPCSLAECSLFVDAKVVDVTNCISEGLKGSTKML